MKHILFFLFFTISATCVNAQLSVEEANEAIAQAKETYQEAQKKASKAQAELIRAENELEKARVGIRQAKLQLAQAEKKVNPIVEERYKVIMNPIFEEMTKGNHHGFSVYLPGSETDGLGNLLSKNVDGELKSYLKNYKVDKVKKKKGELFFDNILIPEVSATAMDVYADIDETDDGVYVKTYFDLGGQFLDFTNNDNKVDNAINILEHFARYMRQDNLESRLKDQEKNLEKLYKELESAKKDISKSKEDIQSERNEIVENTNKISQVEEEIDTLNDMIERTRLKLSKVN